MQRSGALGCCLFQELFSCQYSRIPQNSQKYYYSSSKRTTVGLRKNSGDNQAITYRQAAEEGFHWGIPVALGFGVKPLKHQHPNPTIT